MQVAKYLRDNINTGTWAETSKIPSEVDLA